MSCNVKISSTWETITEIHVKIGGTWTPMTQGWTKVSGVWKQFFGTAPETPSYSIGPNLFGTTLFGGFGPALTVSPPPESGGPAPSSSILAGGPLGDSSLG